MYIVAIAWIFVVVLWAAAEATAPQGSLLGAFFTLLLYGALPLGLVLYVMGTPMRRRARFLAERDTAPGEPDGVATGPAEVAGTPGGSTPAGAAAHTPSGATQPDSGGVTAGDPVAPVGKEP